MRKSAPVAFLLAGFLVFGGLFTASPAFAEDDENEDSTSEVIEVDSPPTVHLPKPAPGLNQAPKPESEKKRKELKEKYGKKDRLALPPLVIRPIRDTDDLEAEEDQDDEEDSTIAGSTVRQTPAPDSANNAGVSGSVGIASAGFIAINPVSASNAGNAASGRAVNPEQSNPIDISQIKFSRKTPAEVFIQASQVGLYAMAVGAVALGLVAASRAIRRK